MSDFGQPAKNTWKKITLRDSQAFKRERMFSAINGIKLSPANKNIRKFFFTNRITDLWNSLPDQVIKSKDLLNFEKSLDQHWNDQELLYDNFKAKITTAPDRLDTTSY